MARPKLQRKAIGKEIQVSTPPSPPSITRDVIAQRAYALYVERGGEDGHDVEDWLRAERELREAKSTTKSH